MLSGDRERYIGVEEVNAELFQKTLVQFYGKENPCDQAVSMLTETATRGVLKNFAIFTGRTYKFTIQHRHFPVKFAKLLRKPFFTEHLRWLLLLLFAKYIITKRDLFFKISTM